jgi:hypothetical protein
MDAAALGLPLPDRSTNFARPMSRRPGSLPLHQLPLDHHLGGDAGMIGAGLPQHVAAAHPLEAAETSCSVLLSAWPMCSEPVTFGGGITMVNGAASLRSGAAALNAPLLLPDGGHAAFDIGGLVVFLDHGTAAGMVGGSLKQTVAGPLKGMYVKSTW